MPVNSLPYPEEFERMVYAREVEPSYSAIARRFGVSRAWASKYYNKQGVDIQTLKRSRQITISRCDCISVISSGKTIKAGAETFGLSPSQYKRSLREHGLTQRKRLDILREIHKRQANEEYLYLCDKAGRNLSSHDLKSQKKHKLYGRIYRLFGSFVEFRNQVGEGKSG